MSAVDHRLVEFGSRWRQKPVLREIYQDLYRRMAARCAAGRTLEIGGGSGGFKEFAPNCMASDILFAPWLDIVADAQALPFAAESLSNIVMFDVLHHIPSPVRFFSEARRVMRPGGRIIFVEPAITPISWLFYQFLHQEPVRMAVNPLSETPLSSGDPFDSNQGIPTLLAGRYRQEFEKTFPDLSIREATRLSFFAYPLSGGFKRWSLLPASLVPGLLKIENRLQPLLGPLMAFRLLAVVEKTSGPGNITW